MLHQKGDNNAALKALDAAMPAAADHYDAHYYRGTVLQALKRHDDAMAAFGKAIALKPQRFEAHYALAGTLATTGREDEAIRAYKRAIEAQPDYLPAHREYNNLTHAMGRDVRALQSYAFGRSQAGDTPELLLAEAELMLRLNDGAAAERLLRLAPQDRADIAGALGRALALDGRFEEATDILRRAVRAEPMAVVHYHGLAVTMLRAGLTAQAQEILLQALALDPHHQATLELSHWSIASWAIPNFPGFSIRPPWCANISWPFRRVSPTRKASTAPWPWNWHGCTHAAWRL